MKKLFVLLYLILPILAFANPDWAAPAAGEEYSEAKPLLKVSVLSEPSRGQPLVVRMFSTSNVDYFKISWQGITIEVPAKYDQAAAQGSSTVGCYAEAMLPTVYEKHGKFPLNVTAYTGKKTQKQAMDVMVNDKDYPKESLTVEPKYVNPGKEAQARISRESKLSRPALRTFSNEQLWVLPISRPSNEISGVWGEQRVFNGVPKSKHGGMDFRGKTGEPIYAAADGKVVLTGDFYYNGQFVFIDHGLGVVTVYLHMSEIIAKRGDVVKRGDLIGKVGATGRVTGPHLHFSLYVQGISVDPEPMFSAK
jgi:murein DD-endopeptidase MepM/ murein hydrolase activator NlpD